MSLPVRTTPESDEQIRRIDDWWRSNRPEAPDVFLSELGATQRYMHLSPAALDSAIRLLDGGGGGRNFGDMLETAGTESAISNP